MFTTVHVPQPTDLLPEGMNPAKYYSCSLSLLNEDGRRAYHARVGPALDRVIDLRACKLDYAKNGVEAERQYIVRRREVFRELMRNPSYRAS